MKVLSIALLILVGTLLFAGISSAATITVTSLADDGGAGELRAAIKTANMDRGGDTINFASGLTGTITLSSSLPVISYGVTIQGPGASSLFVDGATLYRALYIGAYGGTITVSGITFQNCSDQLSGNGGGAIFVQPNSTLVLTDCALTRDVATNFGGAMFNWGTATITRCTFSQNGSNYNYEYGGDIYNAGTATLSNCTLTKSSSASSDGGAVYNSNSSSITLTTCTLAGNSAEYGGALYNNGSTVLTGCTLSGNSASFGGALWCEGGSVSITNCTVAGNTAGGAAGIQVESGEVVLTNCTFSGNSINQGYYFFYGYGCAVVVESGFASLTNCIFYGDISMGQPELASNMTNGISAMYCDVEGGVPVAYDNGGNISSNPLLGPLANNGGPTSTMAILTGSPCYGAGTASGAPTTDQRGVARPNPPSIGAYDGTPPPPPTITSFTPTTGPVGASVTITGTNLANATTVTFNGSQSTSITANTATSLVATVPASATTGPITVSASGGTATSTANFIVVLPPTISAFAPTSGPAGTPIKIVGTNLSNASNVTFNGAGTTNITANSATQLYAAVATNAPVGAGVITVTTPGGTGASKTMFTVTQTPPPSVAGFTPAGGPVGTTVKITGTNLNYATIVTIGGSTVTNITSDTATEIDAIVPVGANTGVITVTTAGGTASSTASFTVVALPVITSFTPSSGAVGDTVTITGTALANATSVTFGGVAATSIPNDTDTQIVVVVPATAPLGPDVITVTTLGGTATSASSYTVEPVPTITSITPPIGAVGLAVTITGTNLLSATSITFNGTNADLTGITDTLTQIIVDVPLGATTGPVVVTTQYGPATSAAPFVVIPTPTITSFAPASGMVASSVTITGTNLASATAVKFGTFAATSITSNTSTQVTALVPIGTPVGPCTISITTAGGTATSATSFTVAVTPTATITQISPLSGPVGTTVTITGTNLANVTSLTLNGTAITNISTDTDTKIICLVPANATTGLIAVTTPGGPVTGASAFTVIQPPTITGIAPSASGVNTSVTITGTWLANATSVTFNGTPATAITSDTATQITLSVPLGATSGTIIVTTVAGSSSSTIFTVLPTPNVAGFTPATGPAGTQVTVTGTNLANITNVYFNGIPSTTLTGNSSTQITAVVPPGQTTGVVTVVSAGGISTSSATFTVIPPPIITGFSPNTGPVGTTVKISGSGLANAVAVTFFGTASTNVTTDTGTQIVATVPAGATTGVVAVRTVAGITTNVGVFTVIPLPAISGLSPGSGPIGTTVTVSGSGLTNATSVTFNGVPATDVISDTITQIVAVVPTGTPIGPGTIGVTTAGGVAASAGSFTVIPMPSISGVSPTSGTAGTLVTITGAGLANAMSVTFGSVAASSIISDTAGQITAVLPAGATTGSVTVTTGGGSSTSAATFNVIPTPSITSFSPATGSVGSSVTILGSGLSSATSVTFNGVSAASITSNTATKIVAVVPAGATTGTLSVTAAGEVATSATSFTVIPAPAVSSLSPSSGISGATVTILGSGLANATVSFNGTAAPGITSNTASQILVLVPTGTSSGPVTITTPGGTVTVGGGFTIVAPPSIASISPSSAAVGAPITILGAGLGNATVSFTGAAANGITSDVAGEIDVFVPIGATTGPITVTTPGGTTTSGTSIAVIQAPTITGVAPSNCAVGTTVQIVGTNLANAIGVTFGGMPVTSIISSSATIIWVVVPNGAVSGNVVVSTAGGVATSIGAFTLAAMHTFQAGLALISVPADYSNQSAATTLGIPAPTLAIWNQSMFTYDVTPAADASSLTVGRGYWVRFAQAASITNVGVATPTNAPFTIALQAGWNMIGDPFPGDEPISGITVTPAGGAAQTMAAATADKLIASPFWSYDGGSYSQSSTLSPYQGYWVNAGQACTLSIPPPTTGPPIPFLRAGS